MDYKIEWCNLYNFISWWFDNDFWMGMEQNNVLDVKAMQFDYIAGAFILDWIFYSKDK